jgi:predicted permease
MQVTLLVLEIVAPVFILAAIGVIWVKLGLEYRVAFVSRLAMKLALPCLIFMALIKSQIDPAQIANLALAALTAHVVLVPIFWAITKAMRLEMSTYLAPLIFGNTGNLGLPLALFAFGQAGLDAAVIIFAVSLILAFTFGIWVVSGGGNLTGLVREPSVIAIPLAAAVMYWDIPLPNWTTNTLDLIGQMAIPLMLLTLGVAVGRLKPQGLARAIALSVVKVAICFGSAWLIADWFALSDVAFAVLVLQMSTPVAVTAYLIAESYGAKSEDVAGLVVASTLVSVLAIPLILSFFV